MDTMVNFKTFYDIESKGPEYYGTREYFNKNGEWIMSAPFGYDFKCDGNYGYIHYWSNITGDSEYIYKVSLERYNDLYGEFMTEEEGEFNSMRAYEDWEYKDILDAVFREVP